MENFEIRLLPADVSLAEALARYYRKNRAFLREFEPLRGEEFYTAAYQAEILAGEVRDREERRSCRFYIATPEAPGEIIGVIGLNNIVWGAFRSAHLGYKLDEGCRNRGYMTRAVAMVTEYAFDTLGLHRIEANVMPGNRASLRVLEKNGYENEGLSRYYLNINGVWEDHIHMVKINFAMHSEEDGHDCG